MGTTFNEAEHPRARGKFSLKDLAEADVQLLSPADPRTQVSVPDPDDPFGEPIFEGPAAGAGKSLVPGSYTAYGVEDPDMAYLLTVPNPGHVEWAGDLTCVTSRTATIDGHRVSEAMVHGDDPDDATALRNVTVDRHPVGQVHFSFDDAGWRASGPGGGRPSVHDTEDDAVRALVSAVLTAS
jgi:hypothetical protein